MDYLQQVADKIKEELKLKTAIVSVEDIKFYPELRELCVMNTCGNYGKNHTCPPNVGEIHSLIERAKTYQRAIIVQNVYELEDSYDYEGMVEGAKRFKGSFDQAEEIARERIEDPLLLACGGCSYCVRCSALDEEACRFPDRARASLESYGIQVSQLAESAGMNYINGVNTVTYFGGILVKE